ncbi:ABCF3 [Mytilus edulis]|uniref:ABCF3 n=1 Tax=Mytilus edulis TaxID=6550 RepID=A0A8S3QA31_MYTED|nr:ABCF3 [Mytilus edulis]
MEMGNVSKRLRQQHDQRVKTTTVTTVEIDEETYEEIYKSTKRNIPMLFVRGDGITGKPGADDVITLEVENDVKTELTPFIRSNLSVMVHCYGNRFLTCTACEDSQYIYFSNTGRKLLPSLMLNSPVSRLTSCRQYLMAITQKGNLFVWNVQKSKAVIRNESLMTVMSGRFENLQHVLDMKAIIWLENYLQKWQTTMLVVSHDRMFLNAISTDILYLNNRLIETYRGNYDIFHKTREQRLINQQKEYEAQVQYREHLQVLLIDLDIMPTEMHSVQSKLKILLEKLPPLIAVEKYLLSLLETCPRRRNMPHHRNLSIGYFSQHHVDQLEMDQTSLEMMAEKFPGNNSELYRNKLGQFGEWGFGLETGFKFIWRTEKSGGFCCTVCRSKICYSNLREVSFLVSHDRAFDKNDLQGIMGCQEEIGSDIRRRLRGIQAYRREGVRNELLIMAVF